MNRFRQFMFGRNGFDPLSAGLFVLSFVFVVFFWISGNQILSIPFYLCLLLGMGRALSRNIHRRSRENQRFVAASKSVSSAVRIRAHRLRDIRTHRYFRCPNCGRWLRAPRGRGTINVICSTCHQMFQTKV